MIQTLERENRKWREKQRSIGNDIMANNDCMANINSIARCGTRPPSAVPTNQSTVPSQVALICFALYYCYCYYYYYYHHHFVAIIQDHLHWSAARVKNWKILLVHSLTAHMPLLMTTSAFRLGRGRWSSQWCYLLHLCTFWLCSRAVKFMHQLTR